MGILQRIAAAGEALFRPQAASITKYELTNISQSEELLRALSGAMTNSGEAVNATVAAQLTTVHRCVSLLSRTIASLPLVLYERQGDRKKTPAVNHPLYSLLHDRVNEWQTSDQWRSLCQRDLELRGNAYSLIIRGVGRRVTELIRLHPDRVQPKQDHNLRITYEYTRPDGRRITYARSEILHIWLESEDGITGLNPIAMHRQTIGDALALQKHGSRFFGAGAKPLGVIQIEGKMNEAAREEFRADWEKTYAGGDNSHKTLLLPPGMKYEPVSINMADAQFIENRKFTTADIARIFGVPPHKVGDLEKATFSNIEHQSIEFVQDAIVPRVHGWEQIIARDLLEGDRQYFVKFNIEGLLRGDFKSRQEGMQIQRRNGVINANEWRDREDLNERQDAGGDEYIVEGNMRPQDGSQPLQPQNRSPANDDPSASRDQGTRAANVALLRA